MQNMAGEHERGSGGSGELDLVGMGVERSGLTLEITPSVAPRNDPGGAVVLGEIDKGHDGGGNGVWPAVELGWVVAVEFLSAKRWLRAPVRDLTGLEASTEDLGHDGEQPLVIGDRGDQVAAFVELHQVVGSRRRLVASDLQLGRQLEELGAHGSHLCGAPELRKPGSTTQPAS